MTSDDSGEFTGNQKWFLGIGNSPVIPGSVPGSPWLPGSDGCLAGPGSPEGSPGCLPAPLASQGQEALLPASPGQAASGGSA